MQRLALALSACLGACGDNLPALDASGDPGFQTAPHARMPMVFAHTGTVLSSMQLVTLTYSDYTAASEVAAFGDALVASSWYQQIGGEYRMVSATHPQHVALGPTPTRLGRATIAERIAEVVRSEALVKPSPVNNQVLYLLFVPAGVMLDDDLRELPGYHEMLIVDDVRFPVAVVLDRGTGVAATTTAAARQVINAATNPYVPPKDGYYSDPPRGDPWSLLRREVADLCEGEPAFAEDRFAYPRIYSNRAASESEPPCAPVMPGDVWTEVSAEPSQMQLVKPGGSVQFTLTGWSTSPVDSWQIRLRKADGSIFTEDRMLPELSGDFVNNNKSVTLTLHVPEDAQPGERGGVEIQSGPAAHPWAVGFIVK
jgi:hypothetical protein